MSCTTVYAVYKTKATRLKELKNGHGSGPAIWDYISTKCDGKRFNMFGPDLESFWKLWKDNRLTKNERAVLLCTYDMGFVEVERLQDFAAACKEVHERILADTQWTWSHFEEIGNAADALSKNHDHRCVGLGIGCTSVSDPWEGHNLEIEKAWPIYDQINALDSASEEEKAKM